MGRLTDSTILAATSSASEEACSPSKMMTNGIVRGHGGAVTVETAIGRGTCFHIWLPADDHAVITEPAQLDNQTQDGAGERVMYVDDDEVMTLMVSRLLERSGYKVTTYGVANDALDELRSAPHSVDLIVTDMNMPGLSGLDLLREAKKLRLDLPVIVGSGNFPTEVQAEAAQAGARATYQKQNTLEELPTLLGEVLKHRTA